MNEQQNVKFFLGQISMLEKRFQTIGINEFADLQIRSENSIVAYNAYDFSNTKISYQRRVFERGERQFHFEYNSIDATYNETKITISSNYGVAENVMLTDDLIYQDKSWYVWSPVDVEDDKLSNLTYLSDDMIKQIFHDLLED